jgi:hypothetical protein
MAVESKSLKPFFIKTFRFNDITAEELEEFHKICKRNERTMSEEIELKIKNTVKNHTTGNSQFKIDQWSDNKDMRAVPAFNSTNEEWSRYVKITNYENYIAIREQHEKLGKILINAKVVEGAWIIGVRWYLENMAFIPKFIDQKAIEKSQEAYNKLLHEDNMKYFTAHSKQEYLNKKGVEAYQ